MQLGYHYYCYSPLTELNKQYKKKKERNGPHSVSPSSAIFHSRTVGTEIKEEKQRNVNKMRLDRKWTSRLPRPVLSRTAKKHICSEEPNLILCSTLWNRGQQCFCWILQAAELERVSSYLYSHPVPELWCRTSDQPDNLSYGGVFAVAAWLHFLAHGEPERIKTTSWPK